MNYIPMILILVVIGLAWPHLLPSALAYFIVGGGLAAFFAWACNNHRDKSMAIWAQRLALFNLYVWPLAIVLMFFHAVPKGKKS